MKKLLVFVLFSACARLALADIQDPPSNDYGPTRKLGRGISNALFAPAEMFVTVGTVNHQEGNSAACSYGILRGGCRVAVRHITGLIEIALFPFPTWHDSYYPVLPSDIRFIHAGYGEFPPELGNESKYPYVRDY